MQEWLVFVYSIACKSGLFSIQSIACKSGLFWIYVQFSVQEWLVQCTCSVQEWLVFYLQYSMQQLDALLHAVL